jgi:hypothetical protein
LKTTVSSDIHCRISKSRQPGESCIFRAGLVELLRLENREGILAIHYPAANLIKSSAEWLGGLVGNCYRAAVAMLTEMDRIGTLIDWPLIGQRHFDER